MSLADGVAWEREHGAQPSVGVKLVRIMGKKDEIRAKHFKKSGSVRRWLCK